MTPSVIFVFLITSRTSSVKSVLGSAKSRMSQRLKHMERRISEGRRSKVRGAKGGVAKGRSAKKGILEVRGPRRATPEVRSRKARSPKAGRPKVSTPRRGNSKVQRSKLRRWRIGGSN